ncbi:MAG: hypothetical protein GF364_21555 [Candidatus Lokiarchaeota archaeon]|nr:hypothetical protein [Candidatus Lokiarchaeota archaeon]
MANINNIKLGYPRTVQDKYAAAVPNSYPQRQSVDIEDEEDEDIEDRNVDVDDLEKYNKKSADVINMSNSWAPFRRVPDIRRPPNKPDTIGA